MYKAIKEIGGYKIGEEIPTDKALAWKDMYAVPHVKLVGDEIIEAPEEIIEVDEQDSVEDNGSILNDYLARGSKVVKKNVSEDNLSEDQLKELLKLEESNKNRSIVIKAIKKRL